LMSKNPLDLPKGRKFSKEELAQAVRLAIMAELDAINMYLQFAQATNDELVREVFLEVAKEEKTHVGEFLAILKELDLEQVKELEAGEKEVKELKVK